ncbi:hypothetical protein [Mycobacterium sp. E740]|uniref:hypothetical protein n=1 Tax=Mycobacterium sp. E740 TaxID=1834149 RepID=UPI0012EA4652|nr:hypothetical protein [Mycobacterium sp. E740]
MIELIQSPLPPDQAATARKSARDRNDWGPYIDWASGQTRAAKAARAQTRRIGSTSSAAAPAVGENMRWIERGIAASADELAATGRGQRNDALNRFAHRWGQFPDADREAVYVAARDACQNNGLLADDGPRAFEATFDSGWKSGRAEPQRYPPAAVVGPRPVDGRRPDDGPPGPPPPPTGDADDDAAEAFWSACDELRACRDYARARRVGPWAMLGGALTLAAATIPPFVVLPPVIGSHGSANLYVGLCGPSGSTKSAAIAAARDWLQCEPGTPDAVKPGSGQGIAKCYAHVDVRAKGGPQQRGKRWNAVATITEVDTLTAAGSMQGSSLWAELRSAWSGERVGHDYADPSKAVVLQPHRYRLCMVVGVQPLRAAPLLDDADAGTPQRFVWLPVNDPGAPIERPRAVPPPLRLPPWSLPDDDAPRQFFAQRWADQLHEPADPDSFIVVAIPPEASAAIDAAGTARLRGTPGTDPLDGHRLLCQLKIAAALARLRRHDEITAEDWQLASTVMAVSDRTRDDVRAEIAADAARRNVRTAEAAGRRKVVESRVVADAEAADVARVAALIVAALERAEGRTLSRAAVRRALGVDRNRALLDGALTYLEVDGRIAVESVEYRGQPGVKFTLLDDDEQTQ